jgi:surfactin synthase thioesterase subunit
MTTDEFNSIAWRDFLLWAWNTPTMREQFTVATGVEFGSVRTPLDLAIDAATGAHDSLAAQFIDWATREHWGLESAPAEYQKAVAAKKKVQAITAKKKLP